VTVSVGITTYIGGDDKLSIIERADKALFMAKSAGRNRIRVDELIATEVFK
jgi:diguanylate cyclase